MSHQQYPTMEEGRQFKRTFIRAWRKYRKMTLEKLAEKIDMTASHLSMLERGQRGYTQETLECIAEALRTDPANLLAGGPLDAESILVVWQRASPAQRKIIVELALSVLNRTTEAGNATDPDLFPGGSSAGRVHIKPRPTGGERKGHS